MRSMFLMILAVGMAPLGMGCSGDKEASNFQVKLDAALAIRHPGAQDEALGTVAADAAAAAEPDIVQKAVGKINDPTKRDRTKESAALMLASKGKSAEAVDVAKTINDPLLRDATLNRLTK